MGSTITSRRKAERQKCIVEARVYADGHPALLCRIADLTPDGAKLIAYRPVPALSGKIMVFIPSIGEVWAARIRWCRVQSLGVEFICGEADLAEPETPPEPETFALRMQVAQIADTAKRLSAA
ncbi:PilZ domain-containing protein [Methyloferula stellata]|uniref:PilZ domain-containing protein n=1 Tax=Methyloferula stellata TaxID=876270 RepID=UPI0003613DD0|nr:PilZ domain-containing protein [Methyloferula stellata]